MSKVERLAAHLALSLALLTASSLVNPAMGQCRAQELDKLVASDPNHMDGFGYSVAIDGDIAVIGLPDEDDMGTTAGAAYVFRYDGSNWIEEAKLYAADAETGDQFGMSVGVGGGVIVIGATYEDETDWDAGAAYVFEYVGGVWQQSAKLLASDGVYWDNFGWAVAISGDVIVVGADLSDAVAPNSGSAYVFHKPKRGWKNMTETAKLVASDGTNADEFGTSVAIDGDIVVVGAQHSRDAGDVQVGAAYVYRFDGKDWDQVAKLIASDAELVDLLGMSVAVSGDTVVAGAPAEDDNGESSGCVYVYEKPPSGWTDMTETAKLSASDIGTGDRFGWSVALEGDVVVVAAPAHLHDGDGEGTVYVFEKPPGGWAGATEDASYTASDVIPDDEYAYSVSSGGNRVLVGAWREDPGGVNNAGAAYVHGGLLDCQPNGALDVCDLSRGLSSDTGGNGVPDECEAAGDGSGSIESTLFADKTAGEEIRLSWDLSCLTGDDDYEVYEGPLGDFTGHFARFCTTEGILQVTFLPDPGDRYFLVAPRNILYEGSLGRGSDGFERPVAPDGCLPRVIADCP